MHAYSPQKSGGLNGINNGVNGTSVAGHVGVDRDGGTNTVKGGGVGEWSTPNNQSAGKGGSGIVIIRYEYTRTQIQPIIIDNNFKYISFPNTGANQTLYSINFQEMTEVQILLLDNSEYLETSTPFTINDKLP